MNMQDIYFSAEAQEFHVFTHGGAERSAELKVKRLLKRYGITDVKLQTLAKLAASNDITEYVFKVCSPDLKMIDAIRLETQQLKL